ncbi:hypothetical protein Peur_013886 [Populus x canadensis]
MGTGGGFRFIGGGKRRAQARPRKGHELVIHKKNERERERAYRVRNGVVLACNWKGDSEALAGSSNWLPKS